MIDDLALIAVLRCRACDAIRRADARYAAGSLGVVKFGRSWRIQGERPTSEEWRQLRPEHEQTRRAISEAVGRRNVGMGAS